MIRAGANPEFAQIRLIRAGLHGDWSYVIKPR